MAANFSLTGTVRLVPEWRDDLNTTTVLDTVNASVPLTLANGTGDNQADAYYKDVITIAASATATIDLRALTLNLFGGTGTLSLSKVKAILFRNRSTTASLAIGGPATNRWTAMAADTVTVGPEGVLHTTHPRGGYATTATDKIIAITNNGASAADIEVYIVGVKS